MVAAEAMPKRILVAVDGSENALKATRFAAGMARRYGSELILLHVIPSPGYLVAATPGLGAAPPDLESYYRYTRAQAEKLMADAAQAAERLGVKPRTEVLENASSIVEAITNYAANEGIDLIVVGTRGLGRFKRLLLGSVASGVVSHAHCSVLVVK